MRTMNGVGTPGVLWTLTVFPLPAPAPLQARVLPTVTAPAGTFCLDTPPPVFCLWVPTQVGGGE